MKTRDNSYLKMKRIGQNAQWEGLGRAGVQGEVKDVVVVFDDQDARASARPLSGEWGTGRSDFELLPATL